MFSIHTEFKVGVEELRAGQRRGAVVAHDDKMPARRDAGARGERPLLRQRGIVREMPAGETHRGRAVIAQLQPVAHVAVVERIAELRGIGEAARGLMPPDEIAELRARRHPVLRAAAGAKGDAEVINGQRVLRRAEGAADLAEDRCERGAARGILCVEESGLRRGGRAGEIHRIGAPQRVEADAVHPERLIDGKLTVAAEDDAKRRGPERVQLRQHRACIRRVGEWLIEDLPRAGAGDDAEVRAVRVARGGIVRLEEDAEGEARGELVGESEIDAREVRGGDAPGGPTAHGVSWQGELEVVAPGGRIRRVGQLELERAGAAIVAGGGGIALGVAKGGVSHRGAVFEGG